MNTLILASMGCFGIILAQTIPAIKEGADVLEENGLSKTVIAFMLLLIIGAIGDQYRRLRKNEKGQETKEAAQSAKMDSLEQFNREQLVALVNRCNDHQGESAKMFERGMDHVAKSIDGLSGKIDEFSQMESKKPRT